MTHLTDCSMLRYTEKKKMIGDTAELLLRASTQLSGDIKSQGKSRSLSNKKARQLRSRENEFKRASIAIWGLRGLRICSTILLSLGCLVTRKSIPAFGRRLQKWGRKPSGAFLQVIHRNYRVTLPYDAVISMLC
jgi:hypothetical protein